MRNCLVFPLMPERPGSGSGAAESPLANASPPDDPSGTESASVTRTADATTEQTSNGRFRWRRPAVNMTGAERIVRLLAGVLLAVAGVWIAWGQVHGIAALLMWTLLALGVADLVLSGLLGYCPIYRYLRAPGMRRNS